MSETVDNALAAALFAGVVATGVTVAIERFGGRVGGLLGTLPTTIVPASLGLWAQTGGGEPFTAAMDATPVAMLVNAIFLWLWRAVPPRLPAGLTLGRSLALMTAIALSAWLVLALGVVLLGDAWRARGGDTLVLGLGGAALLVTVGVLGCLGAPAAPRGGRRVGPVTLALRGIFAALAIGACVWVAEVAGPVAAGVAAVFPAIFTTAMAGVWLAQGHAVQAGAVGPMMLGSSSVAAYALFARLTFEPLGPAAGAGAAWALAVVTTTVPAWAWLERRARVARA